MSSKKIYKTPQTKAKRKKAIAKPSRRNKNGLTVKEQMFVEAYLTNGFNKAAAARAAGYAEKYSREQGYQIYSKPHIREYIDKILKERVISSSENVKLISDIAQSNLSDYYVPVPVVKQHKIKVGLQVLIDRIQDEHDLEEEISSHMNMTEEQQDAFFGQQQYRLFQITRYKVELKRNPAATRIIDSDAEIVNEMRLDMCLLVADKERGKVKSITYGKDGFKVEMYSASEAQDKIAKMHGDYEKDNDQKKPVINVEIK